MALGLSLAGWDRIPADSYIHVNGSDIHKVFVSIDITIADVILAKNLGCDCILTHHPIGYSLLNFHKVFDRHVEYMVSNGISKKIAQKLVNKMKHKTSLKTHSLIYDDIISVCKMINMPILNIHQPLDEYMRRVIWNSINNKSISSINGLVKSIACIPEFKNSKTKIRVELGKLENKIDKMIIAIAAGTNGGHEIAKAYFSNGISTVIYLHIDYNDLMRLKSENISGNLVILGHLAGDSIGMNAISNELEKKDILLVKKGIVSN